MRIIETIKLEDWLSGIGVFLVMFRYRDGFSDYLSRNLATLSWVVLARYKWIR